MSQSLIASCLDQVEHAGCWFHMIKALGDHLKKEGLQKKYETHATFNDYIQQFSALALIDPQYITRAFIHLKGRSREFTRVSDESDASPSQGFGGLRAWINYIEKVCCRRSCMLSV